MTAPLSEAVLVAPDGTEFHVSFDDGALWIHARAAFDRSPVIEAFEPNAGNEGWLRYRLQTPVPQQQPPIEIAHKLPTVRV